MQLADRFYGCWLGKAIGGTLGGPFEGVRTPLNLTYYDPVPEGVIPNDDLDLQIVWLHHLRTTGARQVTPELLAEAWTRHIRFPFDEYGICLRNVPMGLRGSDVGAYDNWFGECMGAAIRSELWACVASGEPERAAGFAWCDAVCDHCGEGVWAEVFFAALQSAAFVEQDVDRLLDTALAMLPADSRVRAAISDTRKWHAQGLDVMAVRDRILEAYGESNFTDVKVNLAFTILGWLAGGGDFGRSICIATNCGMDTDCTAATLGALLGILRPDAIPESWSRPIGQGVVVSEPIVGIDVPASLQELTQWTLELKEQLAQDRPPLRQIAPRQPVELADSILPIPARVATGCSAESIATQPETVAWEERELGGHWALLPQGDCAGSALALTLDLQAATDGLLMAYAPVTTRVWLDGRELSSVAGDKTSFGFSAPSFHRGGRAVFRTGPLEEGLHDVLIWVDRPAGDGTEIVFGLGDGKTKLWLPPQWTSPRAVSTA